MLPLPPVIAWTVAAVAAAALGTTVPSILGSVGEVPQSVYPLALSEAVTPHTLDVYPGNWRDRSLLKSSCWARVAAIEFAK